MKFLFTDVFSSEKGDGWRFGMQRDREDSLEFAAASQAIPGPQKGRPEKEHSPANTLVSDVLAIRRVRKYIFTV